MVLFDCLKPEHVVCLLRCSVVLFPITFRSLYNIGLLKLYHRYCHSCFFEYRKVLMVARMMMVNCLCADTEKHGVILLSEPVLSYRRMPVQTRCKIRSTECEMWLVTVMIVISCFRQRQGSMLVNTYAIDCRIIPTGG